MSKKLILFLFLLVLVSPLQVFAQTESTPSFPQNIKEIRQKALSGIKTEREEFKEKIAQIKDARKKNLVERISNNITNSNTKLTSKMAQALTRMENILTNLKNKSTVFKAAGEDTAALETAIAEAGQAITTAQSAVNTQAQKEYAETISDENILRSVIGKMVSQFRLDISTTHKTVVDAKQAVSKAISEAAKLGGVGESNATKSANL